ncbi:hypothetical protein [uncultured Tateyamaria sp.]|uniref:hypothetical protein n=1 Tax=uncultured Tateyamaria sp. TaxID=455651 RepID=UPI00261703D5|nr:hypothetical protein [uncultured Tateyamaria sp.]
MNDLERRVRDAYAHGDRAALVALYREAADGVATEDERAFYLTQAHVFAMETAHPEAQALRDALVRMGRETPL